MTPKGIGYPKKKKKTTTKKIHDNLTAFDRQAKKLGLKKGKKRK